MRARPPSCYQRFVISAWNEKGFCIFGFGKLEKEAIVLRLMVVEFGFWCVSVAVKGCKTRTQPPTLASPRFMRLTIHIKCL